MTFHAQEDTKFQFSQTQVTRDTQQRSVYIRLPAADSLLGNRRRNQK